MTDQKDKYNDYSHKPSDVCRPPRSGSNFPDRWSYVEMNVHELLKIFNNVRSEAMEA